MSSILTNTSAMVALQTLKSINNNLNKTQAEISTGKAVNSAKDNAATWAISRVMDSDVAGFKGIAENLSLGQSTVGVARQAAETVTELLQDIKKKIVTAQEENVDRAKIQTDIDGLRNQITSVVNAAQFNGLNLVTSTATVEILSSLDRTTAGVTASKISVNSQDLRVSTAAPKDAFGANTEGLAAASDSAAFQLAATGGTGVIELDAVAYEMGDQISVTIGGKTATYTFTEADAAATSPTEVAAIGLKKAIEGLGIDGLEIDYNSANAGQLAFTNAGANTLTVNAKFTSAGAGGLGALATLDVTTDAASALTNIESLIQTAIDAASAFGSAQTRIEIQQNFVNKLSDSMRTGIGALVDADMEEVSARLQALQVQQQLGIQSLSIANQAPQSVLSLFR
ncbi:flagellin [Plastorhodobacter daqingensis]|uniref:Flagellin n=1 Tax=Plastorhodobacter daqingensis TaxID=1387281 RepID=A0ABW2UF39_9RHOB